MVVNHHNLSQLTTHTTFSYTDGHELAWYWIFLLSITTALSISLVAVAIYFYHKRRRGSYETLGTQPSFVQRIRTLVNQPKDEQNIQENLRL